MELMAPIMALKKIKKRSEIIIYTDSRYVKDEKELNLGNLSLILSLILFSFLSVLIVLGADIVLTKNIL